MITKQNNFILFEFNNPILYIKIKQNIIPSDDDWDFCKKIINSFFESALIANYKLSLIFDLSNLNKLPSDQYKELSNLFTSNKELTNLVVHKTSFITNKIFIKTAINAYFKIYDSIKPYKVVNSNIDALKYVNTV